MHRIDAPHPARSGRRPPFSSLLRYFCCLISRTLCLSINARFCSFTSLSSAREDLAAFRCLPRSTNNMNIVLRLLIALRRMEAAQSQRIDPLTSTCGHPINSNADDRRLVTLRNTCKVGVVERPAHRCAPEFSARHQFIVMDATCYSSSEGRGACWGSPSKFRH